MYNSEIVIVQSNMTIFFPAMLQYYTPMTQYIEMLSGI